MKYTDNILNLKDFLRVIARYQNDYWLLEDSIKPCIRESPITAREVEEAYKAMNHIAEQVARFILNRNIKVEILNNKFIGQDK